MTRSRRVEDAGPGPDPKYFGEVDFPFRDEPDGMSSSDQSRCVDAQDDSDSRQPRSAVLQRLTGRRRDVLARLLDGDGARRERHLAAGLAAEGTDDSLEALAEAAVDRELRILRQIHLPVLEAVDLIERDRGAGTVAATAHPLYDDPRFRRFLSADADLDGLVDALADDYRRRVLAVLDDRDDPVSRADLAVDAAAALSVTAEQLRVALHHVHLPKLEAQGLLEYDTDDGVVAPARPDVDEWLLAFLTGR